MDIRTEITPKVKLAKVKKERVRKEWSPENPLPTSVPIRDGFKNGRTVVRAFCEGVMTKFPDIKMKEGDFPYTPHVPAAQKVIDWVREVVYRDNGVGEPEIRAVIENWIEWYASNKIDFKYHHKKEKLTLEALYASRSSYFSEKPSNELLIRKATQRKVPVSQPKHSMMEALNRMYAVAKQDPDPVETFITMAVINKGVVMTCLYLRHTKMVPDAVEAVSRVMNKIKAGSSGSHTIRNIYASTWKYRYPGIAKRLVPFSDWEETFESVWRDIPSLVKEDGSDQDHSVSQDFVMQLLEKKL